MYTETQLETNDDNSQENTLASSDFPRPRSRDRFLAYGVVVACVAFLVWQYHPSLIFSDTTTTGGDTGAHFSVAYFYIHNILNHFKLTGWSSSWYDGYPLYVFYFPMSGVITAVFGFFVPYDVAFKLTTVAGTLSLPIALYYFSRSLRVGYLLSGLMSVMSVAYLFDHSFTIDGGNIASTLAGEFSFSISLSLGFVAVAILMVNPRSMTRRVLSGLLLAASLLAHILPAAFFVAVLVFLTLIRRKRDLTVGVIIAGLIMVGISAVWELPLIADYSLSTSMGWSRITTFAASLAPSELRVYLVLAVIGFVASVILKIELGGLFGAVAISSALAFVFFPLKAVYNGRMLPFYVLSIYVLAGIGIFVIVEAIPLFFSTAQILFSDLKENDAIGGLDSFLNWQESTKNAQPSTTLISETSDTTSLGVSEAASDIAENMNQLKTRLQKRRRILFLLASVAMLAVVATQSLGSPSWFPLKVTPTFVQSWIKWNYTGYEAKVGFPAYRALMLEMKSVGAQYGCGRAMWEYNSNENDYGTPMALMLLPYWTNNCIDSMEGLFFESSATTPYHFLNQSELSVAPSQAMSGLPYAGLNLNLGITHLQLLGVKYYMAFSPLLKTEANANPNLSLIATVPAVNPSSPYGVLSESWNIYEVHNASVVQPLTQEPVVMKGLNNSQQSWLGPSLRFYNNPAEYPVERLISGPDFLTRVSPNSTVISTSQTQATAVTNVVQTNDSISFDVSKIGTPILVKESYFPNWHVTGALGPYRATPNEMVVFPTSNHVTLNYGTSRAEELGFLITVGFAVLSVGLIIFAWRNKSKAILVNQDETN